MDELHWLSRTELLIGKEALEILKRSHVLVVGLGGVGSIAAEMICRAGMGKMTIVDGDVYNLTNRNRQTEALASNEGRKKADVIAEKLLDINPKLNLDIKNSYHTGEDMPALLEAGYDYVVDAIDTLTPKVYLLYHSVKKGLKVVSSMGSGGKTTPDKIRIDDISKTNHCDFAYDIRKRLHKLDVYTGITAIYSPEPVSKESKKMVSDELNKKSIIGTISYMPAIFGCYCAYAVISDLAGI